MGALVVVWLLGVAMVYRRCERAGRERWRVELGTLDDDGPRPYRVGWRPRRLSRAPGRVRLTGCASLALGTLVLPGLIATVMISVEVGHAVEAAGPWARGLVGGLACLVWVHAGLATPVLALLVGGELLHRRGDAERSAAQLAFGAYLAAAALAAIAVAVLVLAAEPWVLAAVHLGMAAAWLALARLVRTTARVHAEWFGKPEPVAAVLYARDESECF